MKATAGFTRALGVGMVVLLLLALVGCAKNGTEGEPPPPGLQVSSEAQGAARIGWQAVTWANTQDQFREMVSGQESLVTDVPEMVNSIPEIQEKEQEMRKWRRMARAAGAFSKVSTDSLLWYEEWNDPISGTAGRRALYYDPETGEARFYETIYQFPPQVHLTYDSTEVRAYLGPSLEDTTDDRFLSLHQLSLFEANFFVQQVNGEVVATDWDPQNNVIGATAANEVLYGNQTDLERLVQNAELHPDGSGAFAEVLYFRDNTTRQANVVFHPDNTGEFSEVWRDGTTVTGTFDLFEDDYEGSITRTVNFASHRFVRRLEQSAYFTFNPQDSSSAAAVSEIVFFHNGEVDSTEVQVNRVFEEGHWREYFTIHASNEGDASFVITYFQAHKEIDGEFTDTAGLFYLFHAIEYNDGSGELWLEVYTSRQAYLNGDPPILTAHFIFGPDGSGSGEITENETTYQVKFTAGGEIEFQDNTGNSLTVSGY